MGLGTNEILQRAIVLHRHENLLEAEQLYKVVIDAEPTNAIAHHNLGLIAVYNNQYDQAISLFKKAIDINPSSEKFLSSYINILISNKQFEEAKKSLKIARKRGLANKTIKTLKKSLALAKTKVYPGNEKLSKLWDRHQNGQYGEAEVLAKSITQDFPNHPLSWQILGDIFLKTNRDSDSLNAHLTALKLIPEDPGAHYNAGFALQRLGRLEEAEEEYRQAILRKPDYADAHYNLGVNLQDMGKFDESEVSYRLAIEFNPDNFSAYNNLGNVLKNLDRPNDAAVCYEQAVNLNRGSAEANYNLGTVLETLNRLEESEASYRQAIKIRFDFAEAHNDLGYVLGRMGRSEQAENCYRQSLALKPDLSEAHFNLGTTLSEFGKLEEAEASFRKAIIHRQNYFEAYYNLGNTLAELGRSKEAMDSFNTVIAINPDYVDAYSNKLMHMQYSSDYFPELIYRNHCEFEERFGGLGVRTFLNTSNARLSKAPLRIGYVSADFRKHSVAYFLLPLLENHDPSFVETFCYYNNTLNDTMTEHLISASDHWRSVHHLSNQDLVDLIIRDSIDILVDLSGHTAKHRLLVFAQKPAPIQVTWLGYPDTTGLSAVDYRFTDSIADPVGIADRLHSEKLIRLPKGFLCYKGDNTVFSNSILPKTKQGYTTFGSFNNMLKVTPQVIKVWAKILRKIPNSKLILKSNQLNFRSEYYLNLFVQEGIVQDRIEFYGKLPHFEDHLRLYNSIDLCLDPFPYNGATTTCESLWMGVPVVTLLGDRHVGRVGASILNSVGLTDFIAKNIDDYIKLAITKSANEQDLEIVRKKLRNTIQSSQLCDSQFFVGAVENAYREMWQHYSETFAMR